MASKLKERPLVLALSSGTRGDCQPILAVLLALKQKGFDVILFTNPEHSTLIEGCGIEHISNENYFKQLFTSEETATVMKNDDFMTWNAMQTANDLKFAKPWYTKLHQVITTRKPDLLLTCVMHWVDPFQLPMLYHIPALHLHLANAFTLDPDKAPFGLPSAPPGQNFPIWDAVSRGYLAGIEKGPASVLEKLTKKPKRDWFPEAEEWQECLGNWKGFEDMGQFMPMLFLLEDDARLPTDRENFIFSGSPLLKPAQCTGEEFGGLENEVLEKFLASCPEPPIYFGWGSVTCGKPGDMAARAVRALMVLKRKGVILGGWASLSIDLLDGQADAAELKKFCQSNVLFVKTANHGALFPRCAVIVHHGGVGTTNTSMRSGRPTVVTPIFYDQWFSGDLVVKSGVGVKTEHLEKLSGQDLAGYIQKCLSSPQILKTAMEYAAKTRGRDGAEEAAKVIKKFWDEDVQGGKYWAGWEKIAARKKKNNAAKKAAEGCCGWRKILAKLTGKSK